MSDHTPERAAAIVDAARAAGAHDPTEMLVLIPPGEMVNPADAVATIKARKPHFFKKSVAEMDPAEFAAARRDVLRDADRQRQADDQAAMMGRLSRKYPQPKDSK
jgi:hypothetical protein